MSYHEERARAALSVRSLTPTQIEDCLPSVAAALREVQANAFRQCEAFWEGVQRGHEISAQEHADACTNGADCEVCKLKRHIAGLIEAQLAGFRVAFTRDDMRGL